jgi:DNA-binding transcriptional LysR family regulator
MRTSWHSLREFEAFRALIACGTATAAARRLGISQSAVSRAIAQLEARVGVLLFERAGARLAPTADALAFNASLDPLFDALSRLDRERWSRGREALRVVAPPTLSHHFLPRRIASFLALHPEQLIHLDVIASDALVTAIAEGRFDLGLTDYEFSHSGVRTEVLRETEAVCVLPPGHPLGEREVVTPADLVDTPLVGLTRRLSHRSNIDKAFIEAGIEPRVAVEVGTAGAAWECVRQGLGVAILNPFHVLASRIEGVVVRPFRPRFGYRMQFLTPAAAPMNGPTRAFVRHVRLSLGREATRL